MIQAFDYGRIRNQIEACGKGISDLRLIIAFPWALLFLHQHHLQLVTLSTYAILNQNSGNTYKYRNTINVYQYYKGYKEKIPLKMVLIIYAIRRIQSWKQYERCLFYLCFLFVYDYWSYYTLRVWYSYGMI